ncbi:MAG: TlyA family RNA methyltransferase [Bdellovibrionales bacterium]|nr:TlyA family RNA methyltransferase [Bdellovibrionales bacterium]
MPDVPPKVRLDRLLVERGMVESRHRAEALIRTRNVLVGDKIVDKPGTQVRADAEVCFREQPSRFVGRGGDKIDSVFSHFGVEVAGRVAIDIGSSTGGFTDSMLQRGARRVYAVDSGTNQLHHRLRTDPRVVVMEQTNARFLEPERFDPRPDVATVDVSFIGVRKILPALTDVLELPKEMLVLVKPQFELEREAVGKGGVVRDEALHHRAIALVSDCAAQLGLVKRGVVPAPLRGERKGNQEYFLYLSAPGHCAEGAGES